MYYTYWYTQITIKSLIYHTEHTANGPFLPHDYDKLYIEMK